MRDEVLHLTKGKIPPVSRYFSDKDDFRATATECLNESKLQDERRSKIMNDALDEISKAFDDALIDDIQNERGSVYGKFEVQAECVGVIIDTLMQCSIDNNKIPTHQQIGAFAYMAIKLARYAVTPTHKDTLVDLESYCNLIKKMEIEK